MTAEDCSDSYSTSLDASEIAQALLNHGDGVHSSVAELTEQITSETGPTVEQVNAVRTEVAELQSAIEDLVAPACDETEPYEHVGEQIPNDQLRSLLDEYDE